MNGPRWHALSAAEALERLHSNRSGLMDGEAAERLTQVGPNCLPAPRRAAPAAILLDQFRTVVVYLLMVATAISILAGDTIEAAAIAAVLAINTGLGFMMELRARRAMEAVLHLEAPGASVLRSGRLRVINARELVPGDIIELTAGVQVPADARLIDTTDLRANEAALTGESLPVSKSAAATLANDIPLADRTNMAYSATTIVGGIGRAIVIATGRTTEIGRVRELASSIRVEATPLERRLDALGHRLVWLALGVAGLVVVLGAVQSAPAALLLQTGIALAVAAVPEALPAVATIALAVGMKRMAARNALVRRLAAIESLGSTTIICSDKTRTLTSGLMTAVRLWTDGRELDLSAEAAPSPTQDEAVAQLLRTAAAASRSRPESGDADLDPVDAAMIAAAGRTLAEGPAICRRGVLVGVVPFSSDRKWMATFHRVDDGVVAAVKGAPRRVLALCSSVRGDRRPLDDAERHALLEINNRFAREGLRVLGVASGRVAEVSEGALHDLTFEGFIGLADPPAHGVKETIARLRAAGLRTVMLTGDQRLTAEAIGRDLGIIRGSGRAIDGRELDAWSGDALREAVAEADAFSRITPEHKLTIVGALQSRGEIVAMLGDGVNDAPALRKADVGVAMGGRGTDVARQAAAIVLRDDRFETIAAAVEEGRVIFDNIRKFVFYLFSCNVAELLVLLLATVAGLPAPLAPLQLLWLNMITDTLPALALAVEPAEADVMTRPPRSPDEAILSGGFLAIIFFYGVLITVSVLGAFTWGLVRAPAQATTMAFMTLALAQIGHLGNARSAQPVVRASRAVANRHALAAAAVATALQVATMHVDPLSRVLRVAPLAPLEWLVVIGLSAVPVIAGQALKRWRAHP